MLRGLGMATDAMMLTDPWSERYKRVVRLRWNSRYGECGLDVERRRGV
jgi:hypothetical protein